ncbi:hypothetical protein HDK77DRAFT_425324 [Phyllosticta capitalensis]
MDLNAINHEYHKIMIDANDNATTIRNADGDVSSPPPAYTQQHPPFESGSEGTLDDDDDDEDYEDLCSNVEQTRSSTHSRSRSQTPESHQEDANAGEKSIHINNKVTVFGSQNILTTAPLDSMRWTASILAILNGNRPLPCQEQQQQQRAAAVQEGQPANVQSVFAQRGGPVNILIDCSVHVIGSRNIIGGNPAAAVYGAAVAGRGNTGAQTQNGAAHAAAAANTANNHNPNRNVAPPTPPSGTETAASPTGRSHPPSNSNSHHAHPSISLPPALPPRQRQQQSPPANNSKKRKHTSDNLCSLALPPPMPMPMSTPMSGGGSTSTSNSRAVGNTPGTAPCSQTGPQTAQLAPLPPSSAPSPPPAPAHPSVVAAIAAQLADAGVCENAPAGADVANGDADGPGMRARKRARREEDGHGVADSDDEGDGEGGGERDDDCA